ncbi:MarR family winged helix-turn-helix transcriptional regulator [Ochrobactrum chromiisoli]|uniref:MarR family transcriptional regulator n=1 Tax=Ochrobactrum chromiisoli TaxID=2993941 RepID=A0ABT3QRM1_9HYPH|nr:MarR family transcriptional regulator [Ochrobactrum chromiisoli]MCX2698180.1 MarR family transcriptional regulator [Ochrobactrum chromiisoli]
MINLDQKYTALIDEARRRGEANIDDMRLCFEVLALATAIDRACAARLAPYQLSESKFVLLFLLRNQDDGLSPHELSELSGVTRATITGLLDGLERDGFLVRHGHIEDRRKVLVRLTPKGEAMALDLFNEHSRWIASLFSGFNSQQREMLSSLLEMAKSNLTTSSQSPFASLSEEKS